MTVSEYQKGVVHTEGGEEILMIRVAKHKTGMTERATISCSGNILEQLREWVKVTRPLFSGSDLVFPKWEGEGSITDLTARVRSFAEKKTSPSQQHSG